MVWEFYFVVRSPDGAFGSFFLEISPPVREIMGFFIFPVAGGTRFALFLLAPSLPEFLEFLDDCEGGRLSKLEMPDNVVSSD